MEVHVQGLSQLLTKLKTLPDKVQKNVTRQVMREVAGEFRDAVRAKAPIGPTGELRRAIKRSDSRGGPWIVSQKVYVAAIKKKALAAQKAAIAAGKKVGRRSKYHVRKGRYAGDAYYAHMVHWGTKAHTITPKGARALYAGYGHPVRRLRHPGARKNPFMLKAWMEHRFRVLRQIQIKMKRGIEVAASGH